MAHHCHGKNCQIIVKPEFLMCFQHWKQVPKVIQNAVWLYYRSGQCDDKNPSKEWLEAADAAIGFVAQKENIPINHLEKLALLKFNLLKVV